MSAETSGSESALELAGDDTPTQHSSKLSLGSSPSVLSGDDEDGRMEDEDDDGGPLTPTEHMLEDEDDGLFGPSDQEPMTPQPADEDEDNQGNDDQDSLDKKSPASTGFGGDLDQDSASSLSSVPDDFPMSRSMSPDQPLSPPAIRKRKQSDVGQPSMKTRRLSRDAKTTLNKPSLRSSPSTTKPRSPSPTVPIPTRTSLSPTSPDSTDKSDQECATDDEQAGQPMELTKPDQDDDIDNDADGEEDDDVLVKQETDLPPHQGVDTKSPSHTKDQDLPQPAQPLHPSQPSDQPEDDHEKQLEHDQDHQQRHKEALDALVHIEEEFARLRDKMYQEKMTELNEEALMIANGTHPELVSLMTEIEEKKKRRIDVAEAWRKYQHANFKKQYEGFEYQANVHFIQSRKNAMRRDLMMEVNDKRWKIEDEHYELNDLAQRQAQAMPDLQHLHLQKMSREDQSMDLQDIKEFLGFPRAPRVPGLSSQDVNDDLVALGLE
ncbi:hypothetical protein DM01DRAFT_1331762 [Hesseltinella vesiculosa]|uniref:Sds3-like-domain-containing protein n=1 Tax=Hesseltinella vesiculosa TaxID=101127 RepID=A0A1X2GWD8_9FUNG|nr:hypothetical protein DM01DRAFT_1331762 [Hesseltinella vesiculosa]